MLYFQIAALGGFILFFGFLAFNGGSQITISNDGDGAAVSRAVVNTVISGSFAAFSSMLINRINFFGSARWSLLITINGALTGMVRMMSCISIFTRSSFQTQKHTYFEKVVVKRESIQNEQFLVLIVTINDSFIDE